MKLRRLWVAYAVDLDALEGVYQVPNGIFPISWLMCLLHNGEQFQTHPHYPTVCARLIQF